MARWLVTDGDQQFAARDIEELKQLARQGKIAAGSMIQPPGATDWLYATEVPELKGLVRARPSTAADDLDFSRPPSAFPRISLIVALAAIAAVGGGYFYHWATSVPEVDKLQLLGGSGGLAITEMLVTTEQAALRSGPSEESSKVGSLAKDQRIHLVAKRGAWYQVEAGRQEGWVAVADVVPAYYFASETERLNYDPVYNPDRYLFVQNPRWIKLAPEDPRAKDGAENTTVFQFILKNESKFEMKDLRLVAQISDRNGQVIEEQEIALEGSVPPFDSAVVGTVKPPERQPDAPERRMTYFTFSEEMHGAPDEEWMRWVDGVEVDLRSATYATADIKLLQATAVPPATP